jgi:single-stranded DNA-binding protein
MLNQVVLTGRVAKDPKFYHQPDGTPVLQFPLELDDSGESLKSKEPGPYGQMPKRKDSQRSLIPVVAFGPLAQSNTELHSGKPLLIKGRLNQRRWKTAEGRVQNRVEVIALELYSMKETGPVQSI